MSHRIIISSIATPASQSGVVISHVEQEEISVTVDYMPSHAMSERDVGKKVAQLLRQVKRMKGEEVHSEDADA